MNSAKYLFSLLAGLLVYVFLSVIYGQNGVFALRQLESQKRIISAHLQEVQNINDDLNLEKTAIRDDADVIAAYARKMDYIFDDEKIVKIKGLVVSEPAMYDTGTVLKSVPVESLSEWYCKCAGLVVGILLFVALLLFDVSYFPSKKRRFHTETIEGIPIYDVAQV